MSALRSSLCLVTVVVGCAVHLPGPEVRDEVGSVVAPEVAVRRSCRSERMPERHAVSRASQVVQVGERSFVVGWRGLGAEVETVVLSIDADGALAVTAIPVPYADPLALGADAGGLVVISVPLHGTGSLLRVALGTDGVLRPGRPAPLPEIGWGWPSTIVSDGTRAYVRHTLATPEQTRGPEMVYTVELARPRVTASVGVSADESMYCDGDCFTLTVARVGADGPARASLVGHGARLEVDVRSSCAAFYEIAVAGGRVLVAPGDPWRVLRSSDTAPFVREAASESGLVPEPDCGPALQPFPSATRPGLIDGARGPRTLLRWDDARERFGAQEALPEQLFDRSALFDHPDGVIELGWNAGSSMDHSPTDDQGRRRYFSRWYFERGQARLLRHAHGRWGSDDVVPLALAGAEGMNHDGYAPVLLRNGLHAAVLLTSQGGEEAWFQPYLAPCARP